MEPARIVTLGLLLALAILAVYWPVVGFDFICYDDPDYVTANPPVLAGLTLEGVKWAFRGAHAANWHPVTWLSHMLDCQWYGLSAGSHHLTNVLFHLANAVLLFSFLRALTRSTWRSAFVAALFGLHPLHVESVAWVSERKDVLSAFFGLLSLFFYARYSLGKARRDRQASIVEGDSSPVVASSPLTYHRPTLDYLLALLLFALALMSKPMLVTLPFLFLLLDFWPLRRFDFASTEKSSASAWLDSNMPSLRSHASPPLGRIVWEKTPFFLFSLMSCLITLLVQKAGGAVVPVAKVGLGMRVMNALVSYVAYVAKLAWPTHLTLVYPYPDHLPLWEVAACALALCVVSLLAWWQRARRPYLFVGWFWFLGSLLPVIGLVQVGNQPMADRYAYLPATGLFIVVAWGAADFITNRSQYRWLMIGAGAAILAGCAVAARAEIWHWRNSETLFRHAIAVTSNNSIAYNHLGLYFAGLHKTNEAMTCYETALAINPRYQQAWNNKGCVLIDQGRYDEAITNLQTALVLAPSFAEAHNNLATALLNRGRIDDALKEYSQALELRPEYAQAHYNLANALAGQGQVADAVSHYRAALRASPGWADGHNNLGFMLLKTGNPGEAAAEFRLALAEDPRLWEAYYGLASACVGTGEAEEAVRAAGKAFDLALAAGDREGAARSQTLLGALRSSKSGGNSPSSTTSPPGTAR